MKLERFSTLACLVASIWLAAPAAAETLVFEYPNAWVQKPAYDKIIAAFEAANPDIKIELRPSQESYATGLQQTLRDAITGTLPDLSVQSLDNLRVLVDRGLAQPVDRLIADDAEFGQKGYSTSILSLCRFDGKQYCLPTVLSLPAIFYNADLVAKAGGDPSHLPETWDGIINLGARIGGDGVTGIWLRYAADSWIWQALVYSQGGTMLGADGKVAFSGDTGLNALRIVHAMGERAKIVDMSYAQARQAFSGGGLGIMVASSAALQTLVQDVQGRFPIRVAPFPILNTDAGRLPAGSDAPVLLTRDPERQKLAWRFALFAAGPIGQNFMTRTTGFMPTNSLAASDPKLLGALFADEPNRMVTLRQLDRAAPWFSFPGPNGLKINEVIVEGMRQVLVRQADPVVTLRNMSDAVQKMLPATP